MLGDRFRRIGGVAVLAMTVGVATLICPAAEPPVEQLRRARVRRAWHVSLPLKLTTKIDAYHLVGGFLFAVGTDGRVRAVRADTGELAWTRQINTPGSSALWAPISAWLDNQHVIVFTRPSDLLFFDPITGFEVEGLEKRELHEPTVSSVAISSDTIFAAEPGGRFRAYPFGKGVPRWQLRTVGLLRFPPLYLADRDLLIVADESGRVSGISGSTRKDVFAVDVDGAPRGELVADSENLYVVSANARLYSIQLDDGDLEWKYLLPNRPAAGPVVTKTSVYQAVIGGGVQRVGLQQEWPNWFAKDAKQFLSEWTDRVALLQTDGKIAIARLQTGQTLAVIDPGEPVRAVSNRFNDAMILAGRHGEIRCYRPIGSPKLTLADFGVVPPKVGTTESEEEGHEAEGDDDTEEEASEDEDTSESGEHDPLRSKSETRR